MKVCGLNECFQLGEKSNYKHSYGKHAIYQPRKSHINVTSLICYSTFFDHSVWVTENGQAFAIGDNNYNQISKALSKETFEKDTEIILTDGNDQQYKFLSAVCCNDYTIYLVSNQSNERSNNKIYYSYANKDSLFLNIGDKNPVALFGGHSTSAIIDSEGSIYIVTKSVFSLPEKKINSLSLPDEEIPVKISFCDDYVIALSSTCHLFEYHLLENSTSTFSEVSELKNFSFVDISGSTGHCFAVTKNGQVFGFGSNEHNKLGLDQKTEKVAKFTHIEPLNGHKIVSAFAGSTHSIFKTSNGKIIGCGGNVNGQLMLKSRPSKKTVFPPIEIPIEDEVTFCIAGNETTVIFTCNEIPMNMPNHKANIDPVKMKSSDENPQKTDENRLTDNQTDDKEQESVEISSDEKRSINASAEKTQKSIDASNDETTKLDEIFSDEKKSLDASNDETAKKSDETSSDEKKYLDNSADETTKKPVEISSDEKKSIDASSNETKTIDISFDGMKQKTTEIELDEKEQDLIELLRKTKEELEIVKQENEFLRKKEESDKQRISHLEKELDKYRKRSSSMHGLDINFSFNELEKIRAIRYEPSLQVFEVIKKDHFILEEYNVGKNGFDIDDVKKKFQNHVITNKLDNPNIIKSHGFAYGDSSKIPSILLEFCPTNLKKKVKKLKNSERISIIIELCYALKEIHSIGLIHGNLKLENILLDLDNHPKISDFGLNKVNLEILSPSQKIKALKFMAPEQINGEKDCDEKVDVYAFGIVVYMILTGGKYPCIDASDIAVGKVAEIPETITPFSKNLIEKCWSFKSSNRPSFDEIYSSLKENENLLI